MKLREIAKVLISASLLLVLANTCQAGFGVSPPWVRNYDLLPGSHFEQTVILSRGDPKKPLRAKVFFDLPEEIKNWISIKEGMEFILPIGGYQVPMTVIVNVPKDAKLGKYQGTIKVETFPEKEGAGVGVAVAAGIAVDLEVTEKEVEGMRMRYTEILAEENTPLKYLMRIENTGNVKTKPDKVYIEIWDYLEQNLLKTGETKDLDWIPPFQTKDIMAEFPIRLGIAAYWAKLKVFKGDQILRDEKLVFEVFEAKPKAPLVAGPSVEKGNKITYIAAGLLLLIVVVLLIWIGRRRKRVFEARKSPQSSKEIKINKKPKPKQGKKIKIKITDIRD
jgi:hypothetical protein